MKNEEITQMRSTMAVININIGKRLILAPKKGWSILVLIGIMLAVNGCHKNVLVPYIVKNNLDQKIYVNRLKGISQYFNRDTTFCIAPSETQIILMERRYCWFGDCRQSIQNRNSLDELSVYQDALAKRELKAREIKIKRQTVKININEKK